MTTIKSISVDLAAQKAPDSLVPSSSQKNIFEFYISMTGEGFSVSSYFKMLRTYRLNLLNLELS